MSRLHSRTLPLILLFSAALNLNADALPESAGTGPNPTLPEPASKIIPTIHVAPAKPWPGGTAPIVAAGLKVQAYATGLDHPRWLYVLPNGDVLVAETNGPTDKDKGGQGGIRAVVQKHEMKEAGATVPSPERITLLRGIDGEGKAQTRAAFLQGLHSPFGMALVGNDFYVANTDSIMRFPYQAGATQITAAGTKVVDLPGQPINHHWTKNILASRDGTKLYATVGSNSNAAENGIDKEKDRAAIHEIDLKTGAMRVLASGLRNPNGMGWEPKTGALWTAVNERDELGNDLVPDYITSVKDGGFYGWPYSYYGQHIDKRVPENPDMVAKAIKPDYAVGSHVAALGFTFYESHLLPAHYHGGAFVGLHGSWNRKPASGYKVIFVPFTNGKPAGAPQDVLTGFLSKDGDAYGRPVGVAIDKFGALLVADDVGNTVWRLTPK